MRKLGFTLLAVIGFAAMSFAQESTNTAQVVAESELILSKNSGEYSFTFPANITLAEVERNAENYKSMFSVTFNATTHEVKMIMVENTPMNRKIMTRMMRSCGVGYVHVNEKILGLRAFVTEYL
jgi:hypothetical protein